MHNSSCCFFYSLYLGVRLYASAHSCSSDTDIYGEQSDGMCLNQQSEQVKYMGPLPSCINHKCFIYFNVIGNNFF